MGGIDCYLDNAATSYPKPQAVTEAVYRFMRDVGGNSGRGTHAHSLGAARKAYECRARLCEHFGAESPEQVAFTLNTTHALNLAIKGLLCEGDHVLISDLEHNAVYRPVHTLAQKGFISYDVFPSMAGDARRTPMRIVAGIAKRLQKNTKMIICTAMSNICSVTMPLREIGEFCRRHSILFVVDGAQGAGHMRLSLRDMKIDALCIPGHKGLLGPQGCGAVIFGEGIVADTIIEGGNGIASLETEMGDAAPERYEGGTLPTPAIAGLSEGLECVKQLTIEQISAHERALFCDAREKLGQIRGVKIYLPNEVGGVLLFGIDKMSSEEVSARLSEQGISTRGGYHCTALGHRTLGTLENGGVRASFGIFNSCEDTDALARAVAKIAKEI